MEAEYEQALTIALRKLRASDHFEAEVRGWLSSYPDETTERVISYLRQHRMIDDERCAEELVRQKSGHGRERLRHELERRGADVDVVAEALPSEALDRDRIMELLRKRFDSSDDYKRAARFLMSRGFEEDLVRSAIESYFGVNDGPA